MRKPFTAKDEENFCLVVDAGDEVIAAVPFRNRDSIPYAPEIVIQRAKRIAAALNVLAGEVA